MNDALERMLAQRDAQTKELEAFYRMLRTLPADTLLALPTDTLGDLDEVCARTPIARELNPLALRA